MQFISNGPDIPSELLQAHETDRVVFFCGAGISRLAGLGDFKGLVDTIYENLGTSQDVQALEESAYNQYQYDSVLELLEARYPGDRVRVRTALHSGLIKPKYKKGAYDTHKALLELAKTKSGSFRLVTTNFDRIFHNLIQQQQTNITEYSAPFIPVAKKSRWNGLVYLHGLLPKKPIEDELNKLVVTSGDFGLAYLVERWAARFVSELLQNYVVCFIGYSLNDPVMRYMMDALAADRRLGESTPPVYAFGDFQENNKEEKEREWRAKGVEPILYYAPEHDHSILHKTIKEWGETYRDGIQGKEQIISSTVIAKPSTSTEQDDFVGRVLWALSDESGRPAKHFANMTPVPSLEWLPPLYECRFNAADLVRFNIPTSDSYDEGFSFSLLSRPSPSQYAPWMQLNGIKTGRWDKIMQHLAHWFTRHLDDPNLFLWLASHAVPLHPRAKT